MPTSPHLLADRSTSARCAGSPLQEIKLQLRRNRPYAHWDIGLVSYTHDPSAGAVPRSLGRRSTGSRICGDAVDKAGLSAFQLSRQVPSGSLVHAAHDGITLAEFRPARRRIRLRGPLSDEAILGPVGLRIPRSRPPAARHRHRDRVPASPCRRGARGLSSIWTPGYAGHHPQRGGIEREAERLGFALLPQCFSAHTRPPAADRRPRTSTMISDTWPALHPRRRASPAFLRSRSADIVAALIGHFARRSESPGACGRYGNARKSSSPPACPHTAFVEFEHQHLNTEDLGTLRGGVSSSRTLWTRSFRGNPRRVHRGSRRHRMRLHRIRANLLAGDPRPAQRSPRVSTNGNRRAGPHVGQIPRPVRRTPVADPARAAR